MRISIAERLRPFCHLPGISTIIPGLGWQVQVFPCLIRMYYFKDAFPLLLTEVNLELKGPIQQFTVCNDLEKGRVTIGGETREGWVRYHLISSQQQKGLRLLIDRAPTQGILMHQGNICRQMHKNEWLDIQDSISPNFSFEAYQLPACDRLSLGNHKAQDWELIKRRSTLSEIFPLWHRLGQLLPAINEPIVEEGNLALLAACQKSLQQGRPEETQQIWLHLFQAGFHSLLVPRLKDEEYQGFSHLPPLVNVQVSPLILLTEGSRLIRQLFIQQKGKEIAILPHLLPSLPQGRLISVPLEGVGVISLEWTKKTIRQLILFAEQDQEVCLHFRSDVRSYRWRQHPKEQGERKSCNSPLLLKKNCYYFFDNFR